MEQQDKTLAARIFFKNCVVSIHIPGELRISQSLTPSSSDVVVNRNFYPENDPSAFIGSHNDFYRFLDLSTSSNSDLIRKLSAIGYLLCNKLPRTGFRYRGVVCVNDEETACANGKTLFGQSISELSNSAVIDGRGFFRPFNEFIFDRKVKEDTTLVLIDDISVNRTTIRRLYPLCTDDWLVNRKGLDPLVLKQSMAPYLLLTTNTPAHRFLIECSAIRRFIPLRFSSFFGIDNPVHKFFGHCFFSEWNEEQWHLFDNFMFYCVREYLRSISLGNDIFRII